jgi:hypothetical protein
MTFNVWGAETLELIFHFVMMPALGAVRGKGSPAAVSAKRVAWTLAFVVSFATQLSPNSVAAEALAAPMADMDTNAATKSPTNFTFIPFLP